MYIEREWLWRWGRVLGQVPFSLGGRCRCPPRVGGRCRCGAAAALLPSRPWEAYSLALVLLCVPSTFAALICYFQEKVGTYNPHTYNKTDKVVSHMDVLIVMLSGNVAVLRALLCRRHFRLFVEELTMVDRLLRARAPCVPLSRVLWLASFVTLSVLHMAYVLYAGGALHALSHLPNQFNYQLIFIMEALFAEETDNIFRRFRTLNARLESTCLGAATRYPIELRPGMTPVGETCRKLPAHALRRGPRADKSSTRTKYFSGGVPEFDGVPIHQLEDAHAMLCSSAVNVTRRYGPVLLVDILNLLLHFVTTSYFFFSMAVVDSKLQRTDAYRLQVHVYVSIQFLWMLAHVSRLVLLVLPCSNVKEEANETGALVGTFLNTLHPSCHLRRQLELFSMQLMHHRICFSPCGLFELDLKLLLSLLGAVTTYLVVLFQIRAPSTDIYVNIANRTV